MEYIVNLAEKSQLAAKIQRSAKHACQGHRVKSSQRVRYPGKQQRVNFLPQKQKEQSLNFIETPMMAPTSRHDSAVDPSEGKKSRPNLLPYASFVEPHLMSMRYRI